MVGRERVLGRGGKLVGKAADVGSVHETRIFSGICSIQYFIGKYGEWFCVLVKSSLGG